MAEPREMGLRDARKDNPARFLRELRELRSHAGLGYVELAARAHYPCDAIKAAEAGPSLPDLPVLSAYVRGCGGTTAEWEERWRAITGCPASPVLAARPAGCSEAADAGARVGAASAAADGHDPDRVMAALNRVADGMTASSSSSSSSGTAGSVPYTAPAQGAMPGPAVPHARPSDAGVFNPTVPRDTPPDALLFGAAVPNAGMSGAGMFDPAVFEALAATPIVPDQAPATDGAGWDAARAQRAGAWDSVPPAQRADNPAPPAALGGDAAPPLTEPTAATAVPAVPGGARQAGTSGHPRLPRIALAALIVVGLLLIATLLAIIS